MRRDVRPNPFLEPLLRLREVTPRLFVSMALIEEYSDNFFASESDPQEEFRTSLNLGTVYRMERGRGFISLANTIRGSYDAGAAQSRYVFANLALNAGYQLPRLSLSLSESFIRSDDIEEATPAGVRRERRPFSQNIVIPQLRYSLTPTTALELGYTNTLVWNDEAVSDNAASRAGNQRGAEGDSVSHAFAAGLQHRFRPDLSGGTNYAFTMVDSKATGDTQSHTASGDLAYVISPRTSTLLRVFGTLNDRRQGTSDVDSGQTDSQILGASIGARRQLTSYLAAFASIGPLVVNREGFPTRVFANWQVSLDGGVPITRRTTLTFSTRQSIDDTAGDIDDVGLVLGQSATLTINHSVSRDLFASVFANFARTQLLEDSVSGISTQDRDFTLLSTGMQLSYALTPIWSLGATYRYQRRDSDVEDGSTDDTGLGGKLSENRVLLSLTAAFPVF
jgi:opacity protein-like surface antigen